MFEALRIFEVREPLAVPYVTPAVDVLGNGAGQILLPPPAPVLLDINSTTLIWENMTGVTGFIVENLTGATWSTLDTVPALPEVQIIWTGFIWQIQKMIGGIWTVLYNGPQPLLPQAIIGDTQQQQTILTPDQIPIWYYPAVGDLPPVVVSGLTISLGGNLDPKGMTVTGAPDSDVNVSYSNPGSANGRASYLGPELYDYDFSPTIGVLYRVRAYNSAGDSQPSNALELTLPSDPDIILGISGYTDGLIVNAYPNSPQGSTWDGSFPWKNSSIPQTWTGWVDASTDSTIDGSAASNAIVTLSGEVYLLQICARTAVGVYGPIWSGTKSDTSTPLGDYTNDATGIDSSPATLTIVQLAGTPTQGSFLSCVPE